MTHDAEPSRVCVLGIWHLGSVYSACLAELGYRVVGWHPDAGMVAGLNQGSPPLFEPGLEKLLTAGVSSGRLAFTTDIAEALSGAQYVIVAFDTPVDENDNVDLSPVTETVPGLAKHMENGAVLVVASQVPVGCCESVRAMVTRLNPSLRFGIACCPENLRLGRAIDDFRNPDMIVIGADSPATSARVDGLFAGIEAPRITMDLASAEMSKHALNSFLAMCISFANEIGNLCDVSGADALRVASALQSDSRIGPGLPLKPGLGFAGATLARDLRVLQKVGKEHGYEPHMVTATLAVNRAQNHVPVRKIRELYGSLEGLTIGVLGLTYKPGTSTLRRSASIDIIRELVDGGAAVKAHDPKADAGEVRRHPEFRFCEDAYSVAEGSDALVIITEWPEYRGLDFRRIGASMRRPVVIDTKNMLDGVLGEEEGFTYLGIGRGKW